MDKNILNVNSITFGKYKGKTLIQIIHTDGGPDYLQWLYNQMKTINKPCATQKALMLYIGTIYELEQKNI